MISNDAQEILEAVAELGRLPAELRVSIEKAKVRRGGLSPETREGLLRCGTAIVVGCRRMADEVEAILDELRRTEGT
jgi:hypothetical protein